MTNKQKEMIEKASRYLDELMQLINDWLDMSRVESDKITEKFKPVALASILSESSELLTPLAEAKKVTIEMDSIHNLPAIYGDRQSLQQAFVNLISNGINYNHEGGTITVSATEEVDGLVVEISDTGIGISKDDLHFIFDEFFRVKHKETRDVRGSGLGLPIAKRIIEAHNGSIKVVSELGKGTTFSIFLPKPGAEQ